MEFNLSDETLDHLRYHLTRYRDATKKLGDKAKRKSDVERYQLHLDQINDLIAIFDETAEPTAEIIAHNEGTVFALDFTTKQALDWARESFETEGWQWLGPARLVVDHRVAPDVVYRLRDAGFNVEVR